MRVLVLMDNAAVRPELATEHGLSMWLEADGKHLLFDTGASDGFAANAAALGVNLSLTDAVVLSHGHYDHTSGLPGLLGVVHPPVYVSPGATLDRYARQAEEPHKPIGMPRATAQALAERTITFTDKPTPITEHVWATGPIPRNTPFEDTGGPFFLDASCEQADHLLDDQALWLETREGISVLLGCAHSGVVNTLDYVAKLTGCSEFHAVIGGTHLVNATEERLEETARALERYRVRILAPCHCTGEAPLRFLEARLPQAFTATGAGGIFIFDV